jgi:hypothetical protein
MEIQTDFMYGTGTDGSDLILDQSVPQKVW